MSDVIRHRGVVESVADGVVRVRIMTSAACGSCGVAGRCHATEGCERVVEVAVGGDAGCYVPGMAVRVTASLRTGRLAVWLAFVAPLLLMAVAAVVASWLKAGEAVVAAAAVGVVAMWWGVLWLLRNRLSSKMSLALELEV